MNNDNVITQEEINETAIAIIHEAIQSISLGRSPQSIWKNSRGN